jgi:hypothetical protein
MCADRLPLVKHTLLIAVGSDLCEATTHDATLILLDFVSGTDLASGKPIRVVCRHVEILVQKIDSGK